MAKWITPKCKNIEEKSLRGCDAIAGVKCAQKLKATRLFVLHPDNSSMMKIMIFIAIIEYVIMQFLFMCE